LYLYENNIKNEGAVSIAFSLLNLTKLTELNLQLYNNIISREGAQSFAKALSNLKKLNKLDLNFS
jgi:Ran GTPase-activating protein (RanGAP) involved in mRNA processing and transport